MQAAEGGIRLARAVAEEALAALADVSRTPASFGFSATQPREMKAAADRILEDVILGRLLPTGLPVLSEESGLVEGARSDGLRWVVDPLDGTVNFCRGLAACAVSIALCRDDQPVFGVIGEFPSRRIAWGGRGLGAFLDGERLRVSTVSARNEAVLCTGLPARFDFSEQPLAQFSKRLAAFAKIRMLGAASVSLLQVARGAADAYAEDDIMLWDVAAGLALVEGAGGIVAVRAGRVPEARRVFASNGLITE